MLLKVLLKMSFLPVDAVKEDESCHVVKYFILIHHEKEIFLKYSPNGNSCHRTNKKVTTTVDRYLIMLG